jgi:hypothetical protein
VAYEKQVERAGVVCMKIYVVIGTTGEYSDRSEWLVSAYYSEDDAKQHVLRADEYAKTIMSSMAHNSYDERMEARKNNPLDPSFDMDYTGTNYAYQELELKDKFIAPEVLH